MVTSARQEAVDFTSPFMSSGIQPLILDPNEVKHNPFRIVYPFTIDVWFLHLIVFFIVTLLLYLYNRYDPYEWKALAENMMAEEKEADNFNFFNSLWFCASTLFLQSSDSSPRSNAGRCIAGLWWLYVLAMVFLYLTNLNFFVTSDKRLAFIRDINDLNAQKTVKFGTILDSNTNHYLEIYQKALWDKMNNDHADVHVNNLTEGVRRVLNSNGFYALLDESPVLDWVAKQKPCRFKVVGEYLARTQYAFAVAKGSPLAEHISAAIETIRDNGVMEDLEKDWWHTDDHTNYCQNLTEYERSGAYSYGVNDLSGVYYMLCIGMLGSVLVFLVELLCWNKCGDNRPSARSKHKPNRDRFNRGADFDDVPPKKVPPPDSNMWI